MNSITQSELSLWMADSSLLSVDTLPKLKDAVRRYPYFQTVCLLYLKNLALLKDISFEEELARLAICITDRRRLFFLIEEEQYDVKQLFGPIENVQSVDSFSLIDNYLSEIKGEQIDAVDVSKILTPSVSTDYIHWTLEQRQESKEHEVKLHHSDLIDGFIETDRQRPASVRSILPTMEDNNRSKNQIPIQEENQKESFFTETLARIYIKQKRYDKALQIIKKLSLNYPEKNVYFADQIKFLEKLIINTKK